MDDIVRGEWGAGGDTSIQPSPALDVHERATVLVQCSGDTHVMVTADTVSGFVSAPQVVLQRENGTRVGGSQPRAVRNEQGKTVYVTSYELPEPYIDASIVVTGTAASGMVGSAIERFVSVRILEAGEYEVFGPGGALSIIVRVQDTEQPEPVEGTTPAAEASRTLPGAGDTLPAGRPNATSPQGGSKASVRICIGPAPPGILTASEGLTAASDAFIISGAEGSDFTGPVHLTFAADLNERPAEMAFGGDLDLGIYHWDEARHEWSRIKGSSHPNPIGQSLEADIERAGAYAIFARERELIPEELHRENSMLKRIVQAQGQLIAQYESYLRAGLQTAHPSGSDQTDVVRPSQRQPLSGASLLRGPGRRDAGGW